MAPVQPFRVMVTRPRPEGEDLCQHLQAQGFDAIHLPVLEIKPLADNRLLKEQIATLDQYAWAIFVSRSAVRTSAAFLHEKWPQLPTQLRWAAVGEGTAAALQQAGFPAALYPSEDWSSEGLLALPDFQNLTGQKVALFCGEGGRELLGATLQERGAQVAPFISYQRVLPELDLSPYQELLRHDQLNAVVVTSAEGLSNLKKLFADPYWPFLKKIPLVLISERIIIQAKELGFESCFLAKAASHEGILQALNSIRMKAMDSQETKTTTTHPEVPRSRTSFWFLTLLTLALIAAGGLLYYRTDLLNQNVTASLTSFSNETQWNKHQISDLQNELTLLQQRLQQQDETMRRQAQTLQEWRGLSQVGPSNRGRDHSAILDAQYFVRMAGDQLLLNKDLPQAQLLLERAQIELNRVADPQALPLKKALAQDLATLKTVPAINGTSLYLSLTSLQQQIEKLPFVVVPAQTAEAPATAATSSSSLWARGLDRIWRVLRQMVVVYRLPTPNTPPFITPDRRPYIYENLQAVLGDAGWAVLHHDNAVYQSNLQQAANWVREYFSVNSPLTKTVLNELQALQAVSVQPGKEVVLLSPKAFEDYLKAATPAASSAVSS